MKLRILKLHPDAKVPTYATEGAACFDLHAVETDIIGMYASRPVTFRTGLAFEVPPGNVMLVFSRSGHGFNHDTRLANCVGVIDSDYRGEVLVRLTREVSQADLLTVRAGDRIAQAMLVPIPRVAFEVAEQLSITERGENGFGSTGAA